MSSGGVPQFDAAIKEIEASTKTDDNNSNTQTKAVKNVDLRCTFLSIGDIDTVNQNFSSEVFVEGRHTNPAFEVRKIT